MIWVRSEQSWIQWWICVRIVPSTSTGVDDDPSGADWDMTLLLASLSLLFFIELPSLKQVKLCVYRVRLRHHSKHRQAMNGQQAERHPPTHDPSGNVSLRRRPMRWTDKLQVLHLQFRSQVVGTFMIHEFLKREGEGWITGFLNINRIAI